MPDSKKTPPVSSSEPPLDEDDAPVRSPRPSSPEADAPTTDDDASVPVTRELTSAFLAKKATQDRIREVVEYRVPRGTQEADVRDIIQKANVRALSATALARSVPGMRPWLSRLTQNVVIDHYRSDAKHLAWLDRSVDVQELPPDEATDSEPLELAPVPPRPEPVEEIEGDRLHRWLGEHVKTKADRLTLEMLRHKAKAKRTNAAVAAEFGMTEAAFDNRILRFKRRWIPAWKKREARRTILLIVLGVLLAAAAGWLLHRWQTRQEIGPGPTPQIIPASTTTVKDDDFNPAHPAPP